MITRPAGRRLRTFTKIAGVALAGILALLVVATFFVDEPLRRTLERQMNSKLTGYEVRLPHAHFSLWGLAVTLKDLSVRQEAHPEPPVAVIPKLRASVHWRELLSLRLVADFLFDHPTVHIDRAQLLKEAKDEVPVKDRGWQQALESIYPLKINLLTIEDGDITYIDEKEAPPFRVTHLTVQANNIRNIHSKDSVYPSPVFARGTLLERGQGEVHGHANFLAEPYPGFHVLFRLTGVPLDPFRPLVQRSNLVVKNGSLSTSGELELAPAVKLVDVDKLVIRKVGIEYVHTPQGAATEKKAVKAVERAVATSARKPEVQVKLRRFELTDSVISLTNKARDPAYRVFVDNVNLQLTHLSDDFRDGPAHAHLTGRFMGSGPAEASATFRPTTKGPDLDLKIAVADTDLTRMNDMLRAYGKFDVVAGKFAYYSDLHVKNGFVSGYVKPLFKDMDVYDRRQDAEKSAFRKLYERIVGTLAGLLENRQRDEVATKAQVAGRLDDPKTSTFDVVVRLVQNAFFKAILPGFDEEVARIGRGKRPERAQRKTG